MRAALGRNVLVNMVNVAAGIGASLVSVPFILHRIGTAGYGVWVLGLTFVLYLTIADSGFGPAVQRWVAMSHGRRDVGGARRTAWAALTVYTVLGVAACAGLFLLAHTVASLFVAGGALRADATAMFRLIGVALLLTLWLAALGNVLQGVERYVVITASSAAGSIAYLAGVIGFLSAGRGLTGLADALLAQQAVVLLTRAWALRDMLLGARPAFPGRAQFLEMLGFAGKLQVNALSSLVNSQSDKVVVGLVASPTSLGELGIASQLVDAGRLVTMAALTPIASALAVSVGSGDEVRLRRQFAWMHRTWLLAISGGTIIGLAALYPLIDGWIGGHHEAVVLGLILVLANGVSLLTGTPVVYLRAVGKPGLEARFGPFIVAVNLVFTVPLAIAFGARGVVCGTLAAYVFGTIWFMRRFGDLAPEVDHVAPRELLRPVALALVAGALTLGGGLAIVAAFPTGFALIPLMALTGVAYVGYMATASGRSLSPAGLRELAAGMRAG